VDLSNLLELIADQIISLLSDSTLYTYVLLLGILMLFVAMFVSHTVSAMILLPLFAKIGMDLAESGGTDHSQLLVLVTVLINSGLG
jgi:phosphate transporter